MLERRPAVKIERVGAKVSGVETSRYNEMNTESRVSTDNEAQGQSAKLVDANGVILCLNWHEKLRDFHYLPKMVALYSKSLEL